MCIRDSPMRFADTLVTADKRGERDRFRRGKGRIPPGAVLHRLDGFAVGILIFVRCSLSHKLLLSLIHISLQRSLPDGLIVDAAWLERHGYSRALRKKYVARGWLDHVVRGVYRRPAPKLKEDAGQESLRWQAVVISLQTLLGRPYTVGGRTALELQGFAHYLSGRHREIHLYGCLLYTSRCV